MLACKESSGLSGCRPVPTEVRRAAVGSYAVWASFHAAGVSTVGFLEELARTLPIRALLVKRLGVPFTTVGSEEVASINMDRSRERNGNQRARRPANGRHDGAQMQRQNG